MAEEAVYPTIGAESNKRKYGDSPPLAAAPPRRASGFSSTPDSAAPPSSYNSVPPPMNDFELAKQRAKEIAARLLHDTDPLKRARVENEGGGGGGGGGYDTSDYSTPKPMGYGYSAQSHSVSSGYQSTFKKIEIPNGRVGVIIGKGGETIKQLQLESGAKIQVTRDTDSDPNSAMRGVDLTGTPDEIAAAEKLINDVIAEADAGASSGGSRRYSAQPAGSEQISLKVANNKVGLVIGKGGETIKSMQQRSGARIQVIPLHLPPGDISKERTVQIDGTSEQIEFARQLVEEATSENRVRNPSMSGSYPQQGYQARPPNAWAPPMQQQGYGYPQYSGQSTQYNMNQSPYPGYTSQPTSTGYANAAGWDQSTATQNQQTTPQGGGYDYYSQQQQQPPPQQQQVSNLPSDSSGYNYSQAPAYSQSQAYSQEAYAAYHAQMGYDQQQQQGYNSANYGNVSNPTPEGGPTNPSYSEASQVPPSGHSQTLPPSGQSYPPQSGYGVPQPQKPAGGQAAAYGQPPSSYQAGYGGPAYGAQAGYGQYQSQPYNASYGGGYSQTTAPAYSSDAAAPQSAQAGAAAKASPPS